VHDAIAAARNTTDMPFILGGTKIYAECIPLATHLYLTEIHGIIRSIYVSLMCYFVVEEHDGDTVFPEVDESLFDEVERIELPPLCFRVLLRSGEA